MNGTVIYRRIWLAAFDPPVHCADVAIERLSNGRISQSALRYTTQYLEQPGAFSIDPVHFPLRPGEQRLNVLHAHNLPGVIQDALPERWGRYIRHKLEGVSPGDDIAHLDLRLGAGTGALLFSKPDEPAPTLSYGDHWTLAPALYERMEGSSDVSVNIIAGSSAGGARPKLLLRDAAGHPVIVKFAAPGDEYDVVRSEFAAMQAAASVGIPVPEVELTSIVGHTGLAVRRFDCAREHRRWHMISLATLIDDVVAGNWLEIVRMVAKFSVEPQLDFEHLYRRMIFDALIHNTDNHYRNFCLIHEGQGWRLAPSYDLVPQPAQGQYPFLSFGSMAAWIPQDLRELLTLRERFHLSQRRARTIFDEVMGLDQKEKGWVVDLQVRKR